MSYAQAALCGLSAEKAGQEARRERVSGPDGLDNGDGKSGHACAGFAEERRRCLPPVLDHHDAR